MPLTEEQMEVFGERLVPIFQKLEQSVIRDIARRVKAAEIWTQTAELQAEHLRGLGFSPAKIQAEVLKSLEADANYQAHVAQNTLEYKKRLKREIGATRSELKKAVPGLVEEIGEDSFQADLSFWKTAGERLDKPSGLPRLIRAVQKHTGDELLNLTKSTGFRTANGVITSAQKAYTVVLNDALVKTISGTFSHQEAIHDAVRTLTESGLRKVDFQSGVTRQVDSACRNAILTTSAQLTGDICNMNIEETGVEYVEVSKHAGARPSHAKWQGKVYAYKDFVRICKYGNRKDPDAIYSYHCRHLHFPYWPDVSTPTKWPEEPEPREYQGKRYTYYDATQKQRKMEREIRALKRDACAQSQLDGNSAFDRTAYQIKQKETEYKRFSKAMGIRPKIDRLQVVGYTRDGRKSKHITSIGSSVDTAMETDIIKGKTSFSVLGIDPSKKVEDAKKGVRHGGVYKDALSKSERKLKKSIESHHAQVMEHQNKIENPEKYDSQWDEKTEVQKAGLLKKWRKDMIRNAEQEAIEREVWKERFK